MTMDHAYYSFNFHFLSLSLTLWVTVFGWCASNRYQSKWIAWVCYTIVLYKKRWNACKNITELRGGNGGIGHGIKLTKVQCHTKRVNSKSWWWSRSVRITIKIYGDVHDNVTLPQSEATHCKKYVIVSGARCSKLELSSSNKVSAAWCHANCQLIYREL